MSSVAGGAISSARRRRRGPTTGVSEHLLCILHAAEALRASDS